MVAAFDVPLGHLALDDPGRSAQSPLRVQPVHEPADRVLPQPLAGTAVVRGGKRPEGRWTGARSATRRRSSSGPDRVRCAGPRRPSGCGSRSGSTDVPRSPAGPGRQERKREAEQDDGCARDGAPGPGAGHQPERHAAGAELVAGSTVGSSLFGPRWGCSLAPITPPGNDEGDQLKQAIEWRDIEAVPRRSRRTGQPDPRPHTHPMRQRMISRLHRPSAVLRST